MTSNCSSLHLNRLNKKPSCCYVGRPYCLYPKASVGRGKKAIFQRECSPVYALVTLLYRTLQSTLGYDTVIRRTSVIGCRQQLCIQNWGQTAADTDSPLVFLLLHPPTFWNSFTSFQVQAYFFAYKAIHTSNPPYLANLLHHHKSIRFTCSPSGHLLDVPRSNLSFGSRAFWVSSSYPSSSNTHLFQRSS